MDFQVFLSDQALSDLERIVAYIAPHNAVAAEQMGNQLLDAAPVSPHFRGTRPHGAGIPPTGAARNHPSLVPVEFKHGRRREFENDDAQLCAQALCLEEMFGFAIPSGAVFHAQSKRRRQVEFTAALRAQTESALADLRALLNPQSPALTASVPAARYIEGRCEECSLFEICLPKATSHPPALARAAQRLFEI